MNENASARKLTLIGAALMLLLGFGVAQAENISSAVASGLKIVGKPAAASQTSFEVALPLRNVDELQELLAALHDPTNPQYHHWLTPAQFGTRFGPDPATMSRVVAALTARGFSVQSHTRSLHVSGSVALVESTLGTHLQLAQTNTNAVGTRVVSDGALQLPAELKAVNATVMSFGPIEAKVMSRQVTSQLSVVANRYGQDGGYWYDDLKEAYQYPSWQTFVTVKGKKQRLDGTGVTIGVLMSSDYLPSDVAAMFDHENWSATTGKPNPTLYQDIPINGGGGLYGGAFAEVSIDTQSEIGGAPGAHVVLYDIPDLSDGSIFAGYVDAIEANEVDAISASFGECELFYFPKYNGGTDYRGILTAEDELFMQGNAQGITFLASSGDSAGKGCTTVGYVDDGLPGTFIAGVETPAADPNVTAVGGTNLVTVYKPGSLDSRYATENAWSDPEIPYDPYGLGANVSGGVWGAGSGVSQMWPAPAYQSLVATGYTGRAVPDVGMQVGGCPGGISIVNKKTNFCDGNNNPNDGDGNTDRSYGIYAIAVGNGGGFYGYIGTSLSSPEFTSALALLIEQQGRMGNVNGYLYQTAANQANSGKAATFFHTQTPGFNGLIQSTISPTYNASTGVGTPIVLKVVGAGSATEAGTPQTISNP
jgi:subtilase family serine protease